jgi:ribosome maturation factor RimP
LRVIEPVVRAHGAETVEVELRPEQGGWTLRVYVEKLGASEHLLSTRDAAVSLELCAGVSRDLSPALDVADLIPHAYHLEVSSPGVERPLRDARDFARFQGQKAKIKLRGTPGNPAAARVVVGTLDGVSGDTAYVLEGKKRHEVALTTVESARLVFEFGRVTQEHRKR